MRRIVASFIFLSIFFVLNVFADFPSKTINIIVPSKAGGSTDFTARLFAKVAKKYWKDANFKIIDKPGAGGLIGFEMVARSTPNGYTWGMVFTPQLITHVIAKKSKYTLDSFKVVGNIEEDFEVAVVHPSTHVNSLIDLVKLAKRKKLLVAVNGIGSDDFIAAKKLENLANIKFDYMPTKGSVEQKQAILKNYVDISFMNLSQILSKHKEGKVKIVAILSKKRSNFAPKIATASEQGYSLFMKATRGYVVSSGVKDEVFKKIEDLYIKVVNDADFIKKCKEAYIVLHPMNGEEYKLYLQDLQKTTQKIYNSSPW